MRCRARIRDSMSASFTSARRFTSAAVACGLASSESSSEISFSEKPSSFARLMKRRLSTVSGGYSR